MQKFVIVFLLLVSVAIVFMSCSAGGSVIIINQTDPTVVKDGSTLAPNSLLKFAWTDVYGNPVVCDFILEKDGKLIEEINSVTEVQKVIEEEGHYRASIIPITNSKTRAIKVVRFTVNRMYEELYNSNHGLFYKDDFSGFLEKVYYRTNSENVRIYYSKLVQETIENENNETINKEVYLSLEDTDEDGIQDAFIERPNYGTPLSIPSLINLTDYGTGVIKGILYSDQEIKATSVYIIEGPRKGTIVYYPSPVLLAKVGLEQGVIYKAEIYSSGVGSDVHLLELRERYDSDTKPEFSLSENKIESESRENRLSVNVEAENIARFATLYDTKYLQIAIAFPLSLTLESIEFGNFVDGKKEFTHYHVLEMNDKKVVILYRGLVKGQDENEEITDNFAVLHFSAQENGQGAVSFTQGSGYDFEYGPLFKDVDNKNVDGFIINYSDLELEW